MLVLTRNADESVVLQTTDGDIEVLILGVSSKGQVKLGFNAPDKVDIYRSELLEDGDA